MDITPAQVGTNRPVTEGEIAQQPACWQQTLAMIGQCRQQIDDFIQPLLARPDLRIVLTGAGTSAFIGEILLPWLTRRLAVRIDAVPSTDIVSNPADYLPTHGPLLLVSFARSGNSPESMAAVALANQRVPECYHLLITCHEGGQLFRQYHQQPRVLALLTPAQTHDRGFAMTSSMTCMMLSCLAVFDENNFSAPAFAPVVQCAQGVLDQHPDLRRSPLGTPACKRVVWLGSGGLRGVARESALKLMELTAGRMAVFYDSPTGFRHGPKSIIDADTLVVVAISNHAYTRAYDIDLLQELRADGVAQQVIALAGKPDSAIAQGDHVYLPGASTLTDTGLAFCYLLYGQLFAYLQSLRLGIMPDNPSPDGRVNRVVQGVTIYPFSE